jgi:hypothetical protein
MATLLSQVEAAGFFSWIRVSAYAYPVLLWLHLIALSVWAGLMLLTDVRSLGLGVWKPDLTDAFAAYRWPKRISFLLAAFLGILLFGAKAGQYAYNPWFWVKMLLLLLLGVGSLVLRRNRSENAELRQPGGMKLIAGLSLFLWMGAVLAARGPATIRDLMHSMVDPSAEFLFSSVQIVGDERGVREIAPQTDEDWRQVRARADVLVKAPDLLIASGRRAARPRDRAANPEVELETAELQALLQTNHQDFELRAKKLRDAANIVIQAIDAKDKDALLNALNGIDVACEGCHVRYWYPNDQRAVQAAKEAGILP